MSNAMMSDSFSFRKKMHFSSALTKMHFKKIFNMRNNAGLLSGECFRMCCRPSSSRCILERGKRELIWLSPCIENFS